ncbi:MAG: acyl-CoA dehydrogenase family protein [Actinomycetota bacterium]|nr:acyl-CoA dehydrogenase family protein [Actinomycetota bacterium]
MPSSEIAVFEQECSAFLQDNARPVAQRSAQWGVGDDALSSYAAIEPEADRVRVRDAKRWKALEFDAGFGWLSGPMSAGGGGLTPEHERLYLSMRSEYDVPALGVFVISLGMVASTFLAFGSPEVQALVPQLHRGDLIGCQLFSEPGAGSDLAGLTTRAERDGDQWVITGQKVWTSVAHHSDWGLLLARSESTSSKHDGLTAFALDMRTPGVEVRPLEMMTRGREFNEVFFDGVRISDTRRLGEAGKGWRTAIATLMNERALGAAGNDLFGVERTLERLRLTLQQPGMGADNPVVRQAFARAYSMAQTIRYQAMAADARREAGLPPGPAESVFKLANTETLRRIVDLAGAIWGPRAIADTGEWGAYSWADMILTMPGMRIAGGTDEVMRNILGERVLGLPKDPPPPSTGAGA